MYPKTLDELIKSLERLPGIGEKSAERLAMFIATKMEKETVNDFAVALLNVKDSLKRCKISHLITDQEISSIQLDENRDFETIMIVGDDKDVFAFEKMRTYNGTYHVLGGLIDFSRGITDKELSFDKLLNRINDKIKEVIIATNSTVEGEITAQFIKKLFENYNIKITRLAYGLPVGADLKYADTVTLSKAVEFRKEF